MRLLLLVIAMMTTSACPPGQCAATCASDADCTAGSRCVEDSQGCTQCVPCDGRHC